MAAAMVLAIVFAMAAPPVAAAGRTPAGVVQPPTAPPVDAGSVVHDGPARHWLSSGADERDLVLVGGAFVVVMSFTLLVRWYQDGEDLHRP